MNPKIVNEDYSHWVDGLHYGKLELLAGKNAGSTAPDKNLPYVAVNLVEFDGVIAVQESLRSP